MRHAAVAILVFALFLPLPAANGQAGETEAGSIVSRLRSVGTLSFSDEVASVDLLRWMGIAEVSSTNATSPDLERWNATAAFLEDGAALWSEAPDEAAGHVARANKAAAWAATVQPDLSQDAARLWDDARQMLVDRVIIEGVDFAGQLQSSAAALEVLEAVEVLTPDASPQVQVYSVSSLVESLATRRQADLRHAAALEEEAEQQLELGWPLATPWEQASTSQALHGLREARGLYAHHGDHDSIERVDSAINTLSIEEAAAARQAALVSLSTTALAAMVWFFVLRRITAYQHNVDYVRRAAFLQGAHL